MKPYSNLSVLRDRRTFAMILIEWVWHRIRTEMAAGANESETSERDARVASSKFVFTTIRIHVENVLCRGGGGGDGGVVSSISNENG